jgi:hypothetical protein
VSRHQRELVLRREALVARSATQRGGVIANWETLVRKSAAADRVFSAARRHPAIVAAAVGAVLLLGSRKLFDLTERLLTLYLLFRGR